MDGLATSQTAGHYGTWYTSTRAHILGLGTGPTIGSNCGDGTSDCKELITGVPFIKREICLEINKKLGWGTDAIGTPYIDLDNSYGVVETTLPFNGNYVVTGVNMGTATPTDYSNIMAGCIEGDASPPAGTYSFFQVLIVR